MGRMLNPTGNRQDSGRANLPGEGELRGQRPRRHTHCPLARSLAPRGSPRPRGLRAHRAARAPDESPRPPSSAPSRLACPGQASHLQAPQEEQDASSRRRAANGSDLFIAFRDSAVAAAGEGRRGGGAARVKGRAATSAEAGLGKCAQDGSSRLPGGHLTSGWGGAPGRASSQVRGVAKWRSGR